MARLLFCIGAELVMRHEVRLGILALSLACSAGTGKAAERQPSTTAVPSLPRGMQAPPGTGGIMIPPGDADQAIRSEFRFVEQKGRRDSYAIFAERHPDHPLAKEAARRAKAMAR